MTMSCCCGQWVSDISTNVTHITLRFSLEFNFKLKSVKIPFSISFSRLRKLCCVTGFVKSKNNSYLLCCLSWTRSLIPRLMVSCLCDLRVLESMSLWSKHCENERPQEKWRRVFFEMKRELMSDEYVLSSHKVLCFWSLDVIDHERPWELDCFSHDRREGVSWKMMIRRWSPFFPLCFKHMKRTRNPHRTSFERPAVTFERYLFVLSSSFPCNGVSRSSGFVRLISVEESDTFAVVIDRRRGLLLCLLLGCLI